MLLARQVNRKKVDEAIDLNCLAFEGEYPGEPKDTDGFFTHGLLEIFMQKDWDVLPGNPKLLRVWVGPGEGTLGYMSFVDNLDWDINKYVLSKDVHPISKTKKKFCLGEFEGGNCVLGCY